MPYPKGISPTKNKKLNQKFWAHLRWGKTKMRFFVGRRTRNFLRHFPYKSGRLQSGRSAKVKAKPCNFPIGKSTTPGSFRGTHEKISCGKSGRFRGAVVFVAFFLLANEAMVLSTTIFGSLRPETPAKRRFPSMHGFLDDLKYTCWKVDGATPMLLVYHGPLLSHLLGVAPSTFTTVYSIFHWVFVDPQNINQLTKICFVHSSE